MYGYSTLREEKKLWRKGYKVVAGIDEAGRGPLAGPVVACAATVLQNPNYKLQIPKLKDSKQLTPNQREKLYPILTTHPAIQWGIGKVSPQAIERINIYQATKLAMKKALRDLQKKIMIDFCIIDGTFGLQGLIPWKAIVKGDEKVFSCAAASIIAKVTRDRIMKKYHITYPQYDFDRNKGYGTAFHIAMLKKHGPCLIHRKTFAKVLQK